MVAAGQRAWRTGTASKTQTERLARAAAQKAHATPAVVNLVGIAADSMLPDGIIHAAAHSVPHAHFGWHQQMQADYTSKTII
jgi:hypothetical protein